MKRFSSRAFWLIFLLPLSSVQSSRTQGQTTDAAKRRGQVVVRGEKFTLTLGELEDRLREEPPTRQRIAATQDGLKRYLKELIDFELLAREANRRGYGRDPGVLQIEKEAAVQHFVQSRIDPPRDSKLAAQTRAYFESHKSEFSYAERRRASHILVRTEREAEAVRSEVSGMDFRAFADVARKRSQDNETALRGGELGYFDREGKQGSTTVDANLARAVFALSNLGDVSRPIRVSGGFSILKLTGMRPAVTERFEDVQNRIAFHLWQQARKTAFAETVKRLEQKMRPAVFPQKLQNVRLPLR